MSLKHGQLLLNIANIPAQQLQKQNRDQFVQYWIAVQNSSQTQI